MKRGPYKKAEPVITDELCCYGCGHQAKYVNRQGKLMCGPTNQSCDVIKKKNSDGIALSRAGMTKTEITTMYQDRYNALSEESKNNFNHNKGKTADSYEPLARGSARLRDGFKSGRLSVAERSPEWHRENGKRISATVIEKIINDEWHFVGVRQNIVRYYNGMWFHSSWEVKYAKYLDENNIRWEKNRKWFPYEWEGKEKKYLPDFYLPDTNEFIEIKGYKTDKDEAKWNQFPKTETLVVLMEKELKNLGIDLRKDK